MAEQREFDVSAEQQELRTGLRRFCERQSDEATVRRLMESDDGFDRALWTRLGSELGALGLAVPEELGGSGAGMVDQAVAAEELGAALFCGPLLGTVGLAIPALVASPPGAARDELLPALAEGARTAALVAPLFAPWDGSGTAAGGAGGVGRAQPRRSRRAARGTGRLCPAPSTRSRTPPRRTCCSSSRRRRTARCWRSRSRPG